MEGAGAESLKKLDDEEIEFSQGITDLSSITSVANNSKEIDGAERTEKAIEEEVGSSSSFGISLKSSTESSLILEGIPKSAEVEESTTPSSKPTPRKGKPKEKVMPIFFAAGIASLSEESEKCDNILVQEMGQFDNRITRSQSRKTKPEEPPPRGNVFTGMCQKRTRVWGKSLPPPSTLSKKGRYETIPPFLNDSSSVKIVEDEDDIGGVELENEMKSLKKKDDETEATTVISEQNQSDKQSGTEENKKENAKAAVLVPSFLSSVTNSVLPRPNCQNSNVSVDNSAQLGESMPPQIEPDQSNELAGSSKGSEIIRQQPLSEENLSNLGMGTSSSSNPSSGILAHTQNLPLSIALVEQQNLQKLDSLEKVIISIANIAKSTCSHEEKKKLIKLFMEIVL